MANVLKGLSLFLKIISFFGSLFWRKKSIIYLNSNKKTCNFDEICRSRCIVYNDAKVINIGKQLPVHYKQYKSHFKKMQYHLYQIKRNLKANKHFVYGGFVSPMFAVFDGMQVGNNIKTEFVCYDNNTNSYYSIKYHRKTSNSPDGINMSDCIDNEINIVISSTYKIVSSKYNSSIKTFEFDERLEGRVNNAYLQKVYNFVESILVGTQTTNIRKINLFIAAKQPVCFVVGTAIEERHPEIEVFEYDGNRYSYSLNLKTFVIRSVE